jgi:hypothetical protein
MNKSFPARRGAKSQAGQAALFVLLGLGIFLIGAMAFAIDMSNMWFNRQAAQTAADAACTAGAMDLLIDSTNGTTGQGNFTAGSKPSAFDCNTTNPNNTSTDPAPCVYAALNGFPSSVAQGSTSLGDNVSVDFPDKNNYKNFNFPPTSVAPTTLMRVTITHNIPTFFAGLLKGMTQQHVGAASLCGVIQATSPIPILVLHPTMAGSLTMNGGGSNSSTGCKNPLCGDIVIAGGPSKSIQVNSSNSGAAVTKGGPTINLCPGGNNYCGSNMGVWGAESSPGGSNFWTTTTCSIKTVNNLCKTTQTDPQWNAPSAPVADPLAATSAPGKPTFATYPSSGTAAYTGVSGIAYHSQGCPDPIGCHLFSPGFFPNGIDVKGFTAIFDPGVYYIGGDAKVSQVCNNAGAAGSFCEETGSCIRPSTNTGDGSGGTAFYFADSNSVVVGGGGGSCSGVDSFDTAKGGLGLGVNCTGSSVSPTNLPGSLTGSVLLAPCQAPTGTTLCDPNCTLNLGDPLGVNDPNGEQRGILFFQDRATSSGSNPTWSGNGSMLLAGTMYFHQCIIGGSDTGQGCDFKTPAFNDVLSLGGTTGSSTYVLGDIIIDQLNVGGSGQIVMDLNPSAAYTTLKAALLQ